MVVVALYIANACNFSAADSTWRDDDFGWLVGWLPILTGFALGNLENNFIDYSDSTFDNKITPLEPLQF